MTIQAGESIFLDTNILLTATDASRQKHTVAKSVFSSLLRKGLNIVISGQVVREYMVVCTRPENVNGLGLSYDHAIHNIKNIRERASLLEETQITSEILLHEIAINMLQGKRIHDANIAATMKHHRIKYLLSENSADFECFNDIKIIGLKDIDSISVEP